MKVDGFNGPIKEGTYKGWFEVQSAYISATSLDSRNLPTQEVIVTRRKDSDDWSRIAGSKGLKDITIVFVTADKGSPQEGARITLSKARISIYKVSGSGDQTYETFTLQVTKLTFDKGSPAHASLMVRPDQWGSVHAAALFSRTAVV
jgi:hypothetical protein